MSLTTQEEALVRQLIAENAELLNLAANEATIISKLAAAKKNIGQLDSAASLSNTDVAVVRQGTTDKQMALSMLKSFAMPDQATETTTGVVELATTAEVQSGTDTTRAITPAGLASATRKQLQSITASVASNALTLGLNPTTLDFRSRTLTIGTVNTRTVSSALSLIVPSGATLGTTSAVAARIALLAIDNSGTVELAVVNLAGGVNLDETGLISTTAISASATSASAIYSTTARTSVSFRVVGFVDITEATAGTWATAPTTVQGVGGQARVMSGLIRGTSTYSTSGTAIDFTGIPSWVKRITVMFNGVSTSGTSNLLIRIGSGAITATGYISAGLTQNPGGTLSSIIDTTGYVSGYFQANTNAVSGNVVLSNLYENSWVASTSVSLAVAAMTAGGTKTLSGTIDRIRITTVNGTDVFDAGSINIMWE